MPTAAVGMSGNNRSSNSNSSNRQSNSDRSKTIRVSDLNPLTIPPTLMEYFDKFETVRAATLEEDDNGGLAGTAIIVFQ